MTMKKSNSPNSPSNSTSKFFQNGTSTLSDFRSKLILPISQNSDSKNKKSQSLTNTKNSSNALKKTQLNSLFLGLTSKNEENKEDLNERASKRPRLQGNFESNYQSSNNQHLTPGTKLPSPTSIPVIDLVENEEPTNSNNIQYASTNLKEELFIEDEPLESEILSGNIFPIPSLLKDKALQYETEEYNNYEESNFLPFPPYTKLVNSNIPTPSSKKVVKTVNEATSTFQFENFPNKPLPFPSIFRIDIPWSQEDEKLYGIQCLQKEAKPPPPSKFSPPIPSRNTANVSKNLFDDFQFNLVGKKAFSYPQNQGK